MYRYSVDQAVTYTSEDFVLYKESPFACWMERLTLENPDHGIPPDLGTEPPGNSMERQDELADTLRAEGKNVTLIPWDRDEPSRRLATVDAMRAGADFIVNGQLSVGPLSGSANLLMRTSGYSELGDYLYIPCDTQAKTTLHSAFRLCFLADLLHSLQGQVPPQMLIIRGGSDLLTLQTEDHIYHYRAVKQRFMEEMRSFRKHRMPDPAESSHFGRWGECALEVLKQRAEGKVTDIVEEEVATIEEVPLEQAIPMTVGQAAVVTQEVPSVHFPEPEVVATPVVGGTLADQARSLLPGTYKSGQPSDFHGQPRRAAPEVPDSTASSATPSSSEPTKRVTDALDDLGFIGRGFGASGRTEHAEPAPRLRSEAGSISVPDSTLVTGESQRPESLKSPPRDEFPERDEPQLMTGSRPTEELQPMEELQPIKEPPSVKEPQLVKLSAAMSVEEHVLDTSVPSPVELPNPHPLDSSGFNVHNDSLVDRDAVPFAVPETPRAPTSEINDQVGTGSFDVDCIDDSDYMLPEMANSWADESSTQQAPESAIDCSLNTSEELEQKGQRLPSADS